MELLERFVFVEQPDADAKKHGAPHDSDLPRFHQWDAVRSSAAHARVHGAGHELPGPALGRLGQVEHDRVARPPPLDAARRLTRKPVFDKVVVITDRVVLDRQLQEQVYQFEHAPGVVVRDRRDSKQLARRCRASRRGSSSRRCRSSRRAREVDGAGSALKHRRYAVIVDEAHSSQTGEAAKDLKAVLGGDDSPSRYRDDGRSGRRRCREAAAPTRRPRRAAEPVVLRVHRHPEGQDAGAVRDARRRTARSTRSTSTRCARRSRRASSSTCSQLHDLRAATAASRPGAPRDRAAEGQGVRRRWPGS